MSVFQGWESGITLTTVSEFLGGVNSLGMPAYQSIISGSNYEIMTYLVKANTAVTAGMPLKHESNNIANVLVPIDGTPTSNIIAGIALDDVAAGSTNAVPVRVLVFGKVKSSKIVFAGGTSEANKGIFRNLLRNVGIFTVPTE